MGIQNVVLYGHLSEKFGDTLPIKGDSVPRVLQIMEANFPGEAYRALKEGEYFVWSEGPGGETRGYETADDLLVGTSDGTLHIMPRIDGASSRKGGLMAVIGIALVGVAIVATGGMAAGGLGATMEGLLTGGTLWGTAAQMGIGMALSGVGLLLSPMPDMNIDTDPQDAHQSYIMNGAINTVNEGGAVPVLYGAPYVGSTVISAGIDVEQIAVDT